jgi:hypothetical protein
MDLIPKVFVACVTAVSGIIFPMSCIALILGPAEPRTYGCFGTYSPATDFFDAMFNRPLLFTASTGTVLGIGLLILGVNAWRSRPPNSETYLAA